MQSDVLKPKADVIKLGGWGGKATMRFRDDDTESEASAFAQPLTAKPTVKFAWSANEKVNHEQYHRMLDEYREAKRREKELDVKSRQLAAQLARTEEAAKRALVQSDVSARGGAAQRLLDAERAVCKLREENALLSNQLTRQKKIASDYKTGAEEVKRRLDDVLKQQRITVRKHAELEAHAAKLRRKPEDEFWGEEAGRRFAAQQEELVGLKEENAKLKEIIKSEGPTAHLEALEAQVAELNQLVAFYEKKLKSFAEQQLMPADGCVPGGPGPDDWILEEFPSGNELYLLDRRTNKLFTVPGDGIWPRPVGVRVNGAVQLGGKNKMETFLNELDKLSAANRKGLKALFDRYDVDHSGELDRQELGNMIAELMPHMNPRDAEELRMVLDVDGDGLIQFEEFIETIEQARAARMAAKVGKSIELNEALEHVRDVLRTQKKQIVEAWDELDADHDACLNNTDIVRLLRRFVKDLQAEEVRYLLARLQEWDVGGTGKLTLDELYQAMELCPIYRVRQNGVPSRGTSPTRGGSPRRSMLLGDGHGRYGGNSPGRVNKSVGEGLKEMFLRERVVQLENDIKEAHDRQEGLEDDAKKVEIMRRDLALYKAKIEGLEHDFMKVDLLMRAEAVSDNDELQKAWEVASTFKKRYMEFKADLDNLRITYARMQAQLDETHKLLHQEHKRRFRLEDENTTLQMENMRIKDLEDLLQSERAERVKLEREYLSLQHKALSAPGTALVEVRNLREEVFALRRAKGVAEQKEADVRREMSHIREQLDGMSIEQYRAWQRDYTELKKKLQALELDYQAAQDSLEVYRRADGLSRGEEEVDIDLVAHLGGDLRPDSEKSPEELRRELVELRGLWRIDEAEIRKLHTVLENEAAQTLEAKAALEEALKEMDRVKASMQEELRRMRRELDSRDEKIRKLELQLRGAYSGINRALRSSMGRDGRLTDDPDDMADIGEDQNIFELHITEATLAEDHLGKEPSTFFTFDFFMHETQATPVVSSNTPHYDTVIQYVVDADPFIVEYMDTHVLELQLNRARGWDFDALGVARIPLRQVLEDLEIGAALGLNRAYHYADIFGASGQRLGRIRYGFSFRRGMDSLVKEYRAWARTKRPSEPDPRDPALQALHKAESDAKESAHVRVVVARCEALIPTSAGAVAQPYVYYRFPGHRIPHDSRVLRGSNPVFNDEASWLTARTPDLQKSFATREMEFVVFDEAAGDDPLRGIIGVAHVPLAALAQGEPVEGAFRLINPVSKRPSGRIVLGMGWHNPLQLPGDKGFPSMGDVVRGPIVFSSPLLDERLPADVSLKDYDAATAQQQPPMRASQWAAQQQADMPNRARDAYGGGQAGRPTANNMRSQDPYSQPLQQQPQYPPRPAGNPSPPPAFTAPGYAVPLGPPGTMPGQPPSAAPGAPGTMPGYLQYPPGASSASQHSEQYYAGSASPAGAVLEPSRLPPSVVGSRVPAGRFGMPDAGQRAADDVAGGRDQYGLYAQQDQPSASGVGQHGGGQYRQQSAAYGQYAQDTAQQAAATSTSAAPWQYGQASGQYGQPAAGAGGRRPPSRPPSRGGGSDDDRYGLMADSQAAAQQPYPSQQQPPQQLYGGRGPPGGAVAGDPSRPPVRAPSPSSMLGQNVGLPAGPSAPRPARYVEQDQSRDASSLHERKAPVAVRPSSSAVLRHISPDHADWPSVADAMILRLERLELSEAVLRDDGVKYVFLDSVLLDDSVLPNDQYATDQRDTITIPPEAKRRGPIDLTYTVAYNVLGSGAPSQLASDLRQLLSSGEGLTLTVSLMSTPDPHLDISHSGPGSIRQVGQGELDLTPIWEGTADNFVSTRLELVHSDNEAVVVGHVTVTLIARPFFSALRGLSQG